MSRSMATQWVGEPVLFAAGARFDSAQNRDTPRRWFSTSARIGCPARTASAMRSPALPAVPASWETAGRCSLA